jgi:hypothetical protein
LAEGCSVERHVIDSVCLAAAEVAIVRSQAGWGRWALSIYASLSLTPPVALSDALEALPPGELALLQPAAQRALDSASARQSADDLAGLSALSRLVGS